MALINCQFTITK